MQSRTSGGLHPPNRIRHITVSSRFPPFEGGQGGCDLNDCRLTIVDERISNIEYPKEQRTDNRQPTTCPEFTSGTDNRQLPTSNFQPPTSNFQFPTSNFQLPTSNFQLPTSNLHPATCNPHHLSGYMEIKKIAVTKFVFETAI